MVYKLSHYKCAAKLLKLTKENNINVKQVLFNDRKYKFENIKSLYALVTEALKHWDILEILINESKILVDNPNFNEWHVRILITELIFGKNVVDTNHVFVETILQYEKKFRELLDSKQVQEIKCNEPISVPKVRYVKVNTIKADVESVISCFTEEGWQLTETADCYHSYLDQLKELKPGSQLFLQDFHIPEVLVFPPNTELHWHNLYENGSLCLMDKSSCLAPYLLRPHAHSTVLDMCAAPGLKTIHLAALIQSGKVYAVERDESRFKSLEDMIAVCGADNVVAVHSDVTQLQLNKYSDVEYILLDPSCSGSGMRERQPRTGPQSASDKDRLYKLQGFQLTLLRFALTRFPAAKRVVYSTCSLNLEENEEVVQAALNSKHHEFHLVDATKKLPGWVSVGSENFGFGTKCVYCYPETDFTNGFFVAVFERNKNYLRDDHRQADFANIEIQEKCGNNDIQYNTKNVVGNDNVSFTKVRVKENYLTNENIKTDNSSSKKRIYTSDENIEQYSDQKRFSQNIVNKTVKSSHYKRFDTEGCPSQKCNPDDIKLNYNINNDWNSENQNVTRKRCNKIYFTDGNEKNEVSKKRIFNSNENIKGNNQYKQGVGDNVNSSHHKRFDMEGKTESNVQQNNKISKALTISQKKRKRKLRVKLKNKINTKADKTFTKTSNKELAEQPDKNEKKNNCQINNSQNNMKIKLFSKAQLRYNRAKKLKSKLDKIKNSVSSELDKSNDNESKVRKREKKGKHIGNFDELNKSHEIDILSKKKKHKKIKSQYSNIPSEEVGSIKKKQQEEHPENLNLPEDCSIPNGIGFISNKHKKKHPEELSVTEHNKSISNEETSCRKKKHKKEHLDELSLPEKSSISNEENSRKKKHKKEHPDELSLPENSSISNEENSRIKKHMKEHSDEFSLPEKSSISNEENSRKKKHKKEHPDELSLPENSSISNEENSRIKKHKKEHTDEFSLPEKSSISNDEHSRKKKRKTENANELSLPEKSSFSNEEENSRKKKHKKKHLDDISLPENSGISNEADL